MDFLDSPERILWYAGFLFLDNIFFGPNLYFPSAARLLNRMMSLLFYLVTTPTPRYNLQDRLKLLRGRSFNGITSQFLVSVSRATFADPPPWIALEAIVMLEHSGGESFSYWKVTWNISSHPRISTELASTLLESVYNQELKLISHSFRKPGTPPTQRRLIEENEDEREARLAHLDVEDDDE